MDEYIPTNNSKMIIFIGPYKIISAGIDGAVMHSRSYKISKNIYIGSKVKSIPKNIPKKKIKVC